MQTEQNLLSSREAFDKSGRRPSGKVNKVNANNFLSVSKFSDDPILIQFDQQNSLTPNFQPPSGFNPLTRSLDPTTSLGGGDTNMNLRTATDRSLIGEIGGLRNANKAEDSLLGAELNPRPNRN